MSLFGMSCFQRFLISCLLLARRLIKHRFGKLRQTNCHSLLTMTKFMESSCGSQLAFCYLVVTKAPCHYCILHITHATLLERGLGILTINS
jgi:hypothetical protein